MTSHLESAGIYPQQRFKHIVDGELEINSELEINAEALRDREPRGMCYE